METTPAAEPIRRKTYGNERVVIHKSDLISIIRNDYGILHKELSTEEGAERYMRIIVEETQKMTKTRGMKRSRVYAEIFLNGFITMMNGGKGK